MSEAKKCCKNPCEENTFSLEGGSDEYGDLYINEDEYREISVIQPTCAADDSCVGMSLHSIDRSGKHEILNKFLNKNLRFTISIIEEEDDIGKK